MVRMKSVESNQIGNKMSPILHADKQFETIVSEKSESVMALTPSTALSATLARPRFLSRFYYTLLRMFACSKRKKTRILRGPIVGKHPNADKVTDLMELNFGKDPDFDSSLSSKEDPGSFTVICDGHPIESHSSSFCQMNDGAKEALLRRGVHIPISDQGNKGF